MEADTNIMSQMNGSQAHNSWDKDKYNDLTPVNHRGSIEDEWKT